MVMDARKTLPDMRRAQAIGMGGRRGGIGEAAGAVRAGG